MIINQDNFISKKLDKTILKIVWSSDKTIHDYRLKLGGLSIIEGTNIPEDSEQGTSNTDGLLPGQTIKKGEAVESAISIYTLEKIDFDVDGERIIRIYTKDSLSSWEWIKEDVKFRVVYGRLPKIKVELFTLGDEVLVLHQDYKFSLRPHKDRLLFPEEKQGINLFIGNETKVLATTEDVVFDDTKKQYVCKFPINKELTEEGEYILGTVVRDEWGNKQEQHLVFHVFGPALFPGHCDANFRCSLPPIMKEKDPILYNQFLPIFDSLLCRFYNIVDEMAKLRDVELMPVDFIKFSFREMGLTFPKNIEGFPKGVLQRLLLNANKLHDLRFSLKGLEYYLFLLFPNLKVSIKGFLDPFFISLSSLFLSISNAEQLKTMGEKHDKVRYLTGAFVQNRIDITITETRKGQLTNAVREFISETIPDELPFFIWGNRQKEIKFHFITAE